MEKLILIIHSLAALIIIGLVLLQQGKGAAAGASFGSGASQTVFGSEGSGSFFTKATWFIATLFFCTSFGLAVIAKNHSKVVTETSIIPVVQQQEIPADSDAPVSDIPVSGVPANQTTDSELPVSDVSTNTSGDAANEVPSVAPAGESTSVAPDAKKE